MKSILYMALGIAALGFSLAAPSQAADTMCLREGVIYPKEWHELYSPCTGAVVTVPPAVVTAPAALVTTPSAVVTTPITAPAPEVILLQPRSAPRVTARSESAFANVPMINPDGTTSTYQVEKRYPPLTINSIRRKCNPQVTPAQAGSPNPAEQSTARLYSAYHNDMWLIERWMVDIFWTFRDYASACQKMQEYTPEVVIQPWTED